MNILEELYNGNIAPFETMVPQDREYQLKNQEIIKLKEHFQGVLSTDNMEKFNHLNQLMQEVHYTIRQNLQLWTILLKIEFQKVI